MIPPSCCSRPTSSSDPTMGLPPIHGGRIALVRAALFPAALCLLLSPAPASSQGAPPPAPPAVSAGASPRNAADPVLLFNHANGLYEKGDFPAAAQSYAELARAFPDEAVYHYALGNARLKSGKLGMAVASYLRAFKLAPRNRDIRYNLSFALGRAGEELIPPGVPPALFFLAYALSLQELSGLFWLSLWATCVLWGLFLLSFRPRMLRPSIILLLSLTALFGSWLWLRASLEPDRLAVTLRPDAEVRNGPGPNFSVAYTVPEGRRLSVLEDRGGWVEIGAPREGIKGWMQSDSLERV